MPTDRSRREILAAAAAATATVAGCAARTPSPTEEPPGDGTPTDTPTSSPDTPESDPLPVSGRWPQRGFDAGRSGASPREGVTDAARTYWTRRRIRSGPPVLDGERIYHYAELGEDPEGRATPTPTPGTAGPAHIVDGNPHLVARDASTGALAWWTPLQDPSAGSPVLAAGRVVFGARGEVVAVDPADGSRLWTDAFDPVSHRDSTFPRPVGIPVVAGETLVVPLSGVVDGQDEYVVEPRVRAYSLDGQVRWTVRPPHRGLGAAAGEDVAIVTAGDYDETTVVQARALSDGTVRWERTLADGFYGGPFVGPDAVYATLGTGDLVALSLSDGSERWRVDVDDPAGVAIDADALYAPAGDSLLKLDPGDGSEVWRQSVQGAAFETAPVVGGDVVYAPTQGGEDAAMAAFDAASGEQRWAVTLPSTVVEGDMVMAGARTRPVLGDGAVYVDAVDGLYGFGPAEG